MPFSSIVYSQGSTDDDPRNSQSHSLTDAARSARRMNSYELEALQLALDDYVESIVDSDFPNSNLENASWLHVLPSTTPLLIFQYRVPIGSVRHFGNEVTQHGRYGAVATVVKSGIITIVPYGGIGTVVVRLKPESASVVIGEEIEAFADRKVGLDHVFGREAIALLDEQLHAARTSSDRVSLVTRFLHAKIGTRIPDRAISHAVQALRLDPNTRISSLAHDTSGRQFFRQFQKIVGTTPKRFSRLARFEKVMAARLSGMNWAELSYASGFSDQAHMINDVATILGAPPERALNMVLGHRKEDRHKPGKKHFFLW